jgi:SAM-dependent methyltransferase
MAEEGVREFASAVHRHPGLVAERFARYSWAASLVTGKDVLDAGCGIGWGTAQLAERARKAVGVDISLPAIGEARHTYGDRMAFRREDLRELPFADGEFDVVVCFETVERVEEPNIALDEMRRVLKSDGLLLISAANRDAYPPGNPFHLHEFSAVEVRNALIARFSKVAVHRQHTYFASLLASEETVELDDPSRRVEAEVTKMTGDRRDDALYAVAAATDGELPPAPARIVFGHGVDHEEQRRLTAMWQERALRAEIEADAIRTELEFVRRDQ